MLVLRRPFFYKSSSGDDENVKTAGSTEHPIYLKRRNQSMQHYKLS